MSIFGKVPRLRFRFGLRIGLLILVLVALPFGWFSWCMRGPWRQRAIIAAIHRVRGGIDFESDLDQHEFETELSLEEIEAATTAGRPMRPPGPPWARAILGDDYFDKVVRVGLQNQVHYSSPRANDATLKLVAELPAVRELSLIRVENIDEGLRHLSRMPCVEKMTLAEVNLSEDGLKHLSKMSSVEKVELVQVGLSEEGLKHLAQMPALEDLSLRSVKLTRNVIDGLAKMHLKRLYICNTGITDDDMAFVGRMKGLQFLTLREKNLTDACVKHFKGAVTLEELDIFNTKITWEGAYQVGELLKKSNKLRRVHAQKYPRPKPWRPGYEATEIQAAAGVAP